MSAFATNSCPDGLAPPETGILAQDPAAFVTESRGGKALDVMVRGARCGGCLSKIETAVSGLPGVSIARLNLSTGKLRVEWTGSLSPRRVVEAVTELGYGAAAFDPGKLDDAKTFVEKRLLVALTVAGVATVTTMLFSEAIWFGTDMSSETRTLMH